MPSFRKPATILCVRACARAHCTCHQQSVEPCHATNFVRCNTHINAGIGRRGLTDSENTTAPPCGVHHIGGRVEDPLDLRGRVAISNALQHRIFTQIHLHGGIAPAEKWSVWKTRGWNTVKNTARKLVLRAEWTMNIWEIPIVQTYTKLQGITHGLLFRARWWL